jgi:WhiB family redox-sensing transcriptional regulator
MASPAGERPPSLIGVLFQRPAWMAKAACRGADRDLFFPHRGESTEPAKAIGEGCEVRSECLSAALEYPDTQGIWGGLSDRGRRVLRRVAS